MACLFQDCRETPVYKAPHDGKQVCRVHSPLYFASGIVLDRLNREHRSTCSIESLTRRVVERPENWSVDRNQSTRIARGNRCL